MYNLLIAEYMKIKRNTALKLVVIGICILAIGLSINNIYDIGLACGDFEDETVESLFCSALAMGHNFRHISELLSVFGGIYICYDFERKLCQSAICSGCKKSDIFFSKMIIYFIISSTIFLVYALISTLIPTIVFGNCIKYNNSMIFPMIKIYFICIIYHFARISPIILIAYMVRKTGTTLISWGLLYIGIERAWQGLSLVSETVDNINNNTIWMIHKLINPEMTYLVLLHVLLVCVLYIVISWGGAYISFKRKELN